MLTLHPEALLENVDTWDDAGVIWNWAFYISQGMMISTVRAKLSQGLEFWAGIWPEIFPERSLCFYSWNPIFDYTSHRRDHSYKSQSINYSNSYAASC